LIVTAYDWQIRKTQVIFCVTFECADQQNDLTG
jgi:hypothetical protein